MRRQLKVKSAQCERVPILGDVRLFYVLSNSMLCKFRGAEMPAKYAALVFKRRW